MDERIESGRSAAFAMIVCTLGMKDAYEKKPTGTLAQSIRLIKGRYKEGEKDRATFTLYLKSNQGQARPTAFFDSLFETKFSPSTHKSEDCEFDYFSNAFSLFCNEEGGQRRGRSNL